MLTKATRLITTHPELFKDGDIFDACPECENGGFWPQPRKDADYNLFIQKKQDILHAAFLSIHRSINSHFPSIIGGRSKDVLNQATYDSLIDVTAIDHYVKDPQNYSDYIQYFWNNFHTRTVFSEVGAPIPDLHGNMTEDQQADFMQQVFSQMYKNREHVIGVNYWVYNNGTTGLASPTNQWRKVATVLANFFQSANLNGTVTNNIGEKLANASIQVNDLTTAKTDGNGAYGLPIPARTSYTLTFSASGYISQTQTIILERNQNKVISVKLLPVKKDVLYQLKEASQDLKQKLGIQQ
jgi:hypothetical protein